MKLIPLLALMLFVAACSESISKPNFLFRPATKPGVAAKLGDVEITEAVEDLAGIVLLAAGVQHGQRAFAEQGMDIGVGRIQQAADLPRRQQVHAGPGAEAGVGDAIRHAVIRVGGR